MNAFLGAKFILFCQIFQDLLLYFLSNFPDPTVINSPTSIPGFRVAVLLRYLKATFCIQILAISYLSRNRYSFQILRPFWWDHLIG